CRRRHAANRTSKDGDVEKMSLRLLKQNSDHSRCVDDHVGSPFSSQPMISSSVRVSSTGSDAQWWLIDRISSSRAAVSWRFRASRSSLSRMATITASVMDSPVVAASCRANRSASGAFMLRAKVPNLLVVYLSIYYHDERSGFLAEIAPFTVG